MTGYGIDVRFRHNCGFDPYQPPPSPATFSRFLKQLEKTDVCEILFRQFRDKARGLGLIQEDVVAIDATHLDAFEKVIPRSKCIKDDHSPSWSVKVNPEGNRFF
ncbi:MAG: transposase [Bacillota bacterium]|nr:transposase [Bacillota bacterium]MDW7678003.1 transposase [Bacillota bacterium]